MVPLVAPYLELLNSDIYKSNSNILIISPTATSEELNDIITISNAYRFCSDEVPPCTINEENISSEFKDSYLKFLDANNASPLNSLIFEAKFYDATYLATLTALDNYLFGNNSDKKLDIYLDNSNKCSTTRSTSHCVSKILDNSQLDYVGAFGDLKMTDNTLDR